MRCSVLARLRGVSRQTSQPLQVLSVSSGERLDITRGSWGSDQLMLRKEGSMEIHTLGMDKETCVPSMT